MPDDFSKGFADPEGDVLGHPAASVHREVNIAILGCGTVGGGVVSLLGEVFVFELRDAR